MNGDSEKYSNRDSASTRPGKTFSDEKLRSLIVKCNRAIRIPSSVYRIQLNRDFRFEHAAALAGYFRELGIDALYCSPYFEATPGSMHGYNVTNPRRINPEIGSHEDYIRFCDALSENGLGQIADVVPNHMGITGNNNPWWQDVLENGQSSLYSRYFDIDWKPVTRGLSGKVLLPVLGDFYGRALENGEIGLRYENGMFFAAYYENRFPIDPKTYTLILEDTGSSLARKMGEANPDYLELSSIMTALGNLPSSYEQDPVKSKERNREKDISKRRLGTLARNSEDIRTFIEDRLRAYNGDRENPDSFARLDGLLNLQSYRLAYWLVASQEINYRRFFDINELAAIRIEDESVFRSYHDFLFTLVEDRRIDGLRIDHPDGLYDPHEYFRRLQREFLLRILLAEYEAGGETEEVDLEAARKGLDRLLENEFMATPPFYVVAEKILNRNETLPENWMIHGTVGYDFLNAINGLFVDGRNERRFRTIYEEFIGHGIDFETLVYNKKKLFGLVPMASEINALGQRLDLISETNRKYRDFTMNDLSVAIRETIAGFPVYRTYVSQDSLRISESDAAHIRTAIAHAREKTPSLNPAVFDFLENTLLLKLEIDADSDEMLLYKDFLLRFQQLTGPLMAKGVEDTSFYVYNRLVSLNEVGGDPFHFGYTVSDFHEHNVKRAARWPSSMLATSTHDTKRSEDTRLRIDVLSEIPDEWQAKIVEWTSLNKSHKTIIAETAEPRPNTEYFIYQSLLGTWPDDGFSGESCAIYTERIWQYILKSVREAKIYTNWIRPDTMYENAVEKFVRAIMNEETSGRFLDSFNAFRKKIAFFGKLNGISETVLKIASPGVVDIYQGNETWNYCLVDPDNRRPVDYESRKRLLASVMEKNGNDRNAGPGDYAITGENMARLKFLYTIKGLVFRRRMKELFIGGEYLPVEATGPRQNNIVAFVRRKGKNTVLAVALRFFSELIVNGSFIESDDFWKDTILVLPEGTDHITELGNIFTSETTSLSQADGRSVVHAKDLFRRTSAGILTNTGEAK